jgi:hypothetical protein
MTPYEIEMTAFYLALLSAAIGICILYGILRH